MAITRLLPLLLLLLAASCAAEPSAPFALKPDVVKSLDRYQREYVIAPGDQLEVSVFHVPEMSRTVVVRADGFISLPALKDVKVAGMTVPELDEDLARRYASRLINPEVTVAVANPHAANVYVMGEVNKPGAVPVREAPTVAAAIANSGGIARTAAMGKVAVIHLGADGYLTGTVVDTPDSGESAFYMAMTNMLVQPGDVIVVPESGRSHFTRFVQDFINTPTTGINQILNPYYQFRILSVLTKQ